LLTCSGKRQTEPKDNIKYLSVGAKVFFFFAFGVPIKVTAERESDKEE